MWERTCPKCGKKLVYTGKAAKYHMIRHAQQNGVCKSCAKKGWKRPPFSDKSKNKMRERRIAYMKQNDIFIQSKSATMFLDGLEKIWNVTIEREYPLGGKLFDGRVGNILIEVDGKYWHTQPKAIKVDKEKDDIARRNNFELKRFVVDKQEDVQTVLESIGSGEV